MKQLKQWFAQLPEPIRTEAMWVKLYKDVTLETEYNSLENAIRCAFSWAESGSEETWAQVHADVCNGLYRTTPPLPTVSETIKLLMDAAKRENMALTIHVEPLQGEESRIDLSNTNNK